MFVGVGVVAAVVGGLVWGFDGGMIDALVSAILLAPSIIYLRLLLWGRRPPAVPLEPAELRPLTPFARAPRPSGRAVTIRGVVHVRRAVLSPSGRPCAAWQLVGRGPGGRLHDADLGVFELRRTEGGVAGLVDCDHAFVHAGELGLTDCAGVDGALAAIVRAARVASLGHISDGDLVEVDGCVDLEVVTDGSREPSAVPIFRAWPTIRKLARC
jgi:hypothetical protein